MSIEDALSPSTTDDSEHVLLRKRPASDPVWDAPGWGFRSDESSNSQLIRSLLTRAAELFIEEFGHDNYVAGETSMLVPFMGAAEHAYFPVHKERYPERWDGKRHAGPGEKKFIWDIVSEDDIPKDFAHVLYYHLDVAQEIIYIGKSSRIRNRQNQHRKNAPWWGEIDHMEFVVFDDQKSLDRAELQEIKRHLPRYNVQGIRGRR